MSLGSTCESPGCNNKSTLQCPTCLKLDLPSSYFCSQTCFKSSWPEHKKLHKKPEFVGSTDPYIPWPSYNFTGQLRPRYPLGPKKVVPASIGRPDYADHPEGYPQGERESKMSHTIKVLNDEEIEAMRVVGKLAREVLDEANNMIKVGVTTEEIDKVVHEASVERECYPSPLNYYQFPKSCCTSINEVVCHGIPDQTVLQDGDIVNVDVTVYHRGYHGDLNETMFVGNVNQESKNLVQTTYECLQKAIELVKPGQKYREVGNVIQKYATQHQMSVIRTYCGHGIHDLFHCAPTVPHYSKNKAIGVMKAGHTFTIEPMISLGTWRDDTWPDNWTSVTKDGKRSAQFEETLLVTDIGCEILTRRRDNGGKPYFMG